MTGEELKRIIEESDYTQAEVAKRLGMSRQVFYQKLKVQNIKTDLLTQVAEAIGRDVSSMFGPPRVTQRNESRHNIVGHKVDVNTTSKGREKELIAEIAQLKTTHAEQIAFYQSQLSQTQEQIAQLRKTHAEQIAFYQSLISQAQEQIAHLLEIIK